MSESESATVVITKTEYEELLEAKAVLEALEAGGVDSWDGYDFAMEDRDN